MAVDPKNLDEIKQVLVGQEDALAVVALFEGDQGHAPTGAIKRLVDGWAAPTVSSDEGGST